MQVKKPQLIRQQQIMKKLGFYSGKCDGIWGPDSIAAKREWEYSGKFSPGLPTNGLPFGDREPTPKGVTFDRANGLFTVDGLEEMLQQEPAEEPSAPVSLPEDSVAAEPILATTESVENVESEESTEEQTEQTRHPKHERHHKHRRR